MIELIKNGEISDNPIDPSAVVRHLGNHADNEFEQKRCEKEYDRMVEHIEEIRSEPVYRWPADKK